MKRPKPLHLSSSERSRETVLFEAADRAACRTICRYFFLIERFLEKSVGAAPDRFERDLLRPAPGDDDDGHARSRAARRLDHGEPLGDPLQIRRQMKIAQHHVGPLALHLLDGFGARFRFEHAVIIAERPEELTPQRAVIFNQQHRRFFLLFFGHLNGRRRYRRAQ